MNIKATTPARLLDDGDPGAFDEPEQPAKPQAPPHHHPTSTTDPDHGEAGHHEADARPHPEA